MRNAVGDVKAVMASLGASVEHVPRLTDPRLGGSILRDIGIYTLNFADIVFGGEKPESIQASGHLFDNGVDHTVSITLLYSNKRIAQLLCSGGITICFSVHHPSQFFCFITILLTWCKYPP